MVVPEVSHCQCCLPHIVDRHHCLLPVLCVADLARSVILTALGFEVWHGLVLPCYQYRPLLSSAARAGGIVSTAIVCDGDTCLMLQLLIVCFDTQKSVAT